MNRDRGEYTEHDQARLHAEAAKPGALSDDAQARTPFARDRARVLHSAALRRLAGKTQVVGPNEPAVPRTRLTHSLEVAQIGREIGSALGCDPDIVDTAGLAHDLGHPPFGHNGEQVLNEITQTVGGFEGNAQTLRILTRLEPKVVIGDHSFGLNLTRASLDAAVKYPWPRQDGVGKFGFYADDQAVFHWIRAGAPAERICLEAQVMDWADDVAYSVHDVEDGVLSGHISFSVLKHSDELAELANLAASEFGACPTAAVVEAGAKLIRLPAIAELAHEKFDGSPGAHAMLKEVTSTLVGRFVSTAISETRRHTGHDVLYRYQTDLHVPDSIRAEVALLKAMAVRYVMRSPLLLSTQRAQRELIAELTTTLIDRAPESLDPLFRRGWMTAADDGARLRVVIDQVASLTDVQATILHARLGS